MYAYDMQAGIQHMAINEFVIIFEETEEKAKGMKKTGVLLKATPLGSLQ